MPAPLPQSEIRGLSLIFVPFIQMIGEKSFTNTEGWKTFHQKSNRILSENGLESFSTVNENGNNKKTLDI